MKVQILNWKKFNDKRKDVKKPTWLRLEHDLPQSPSLFGMDSTARYVFISLLCLANKRQTNELEFEPNWFCHFSGSCFSEAELNAALERLNGKCVRIRDEDVTSTSRARDANVTLRDETDVRDVTRRDEDVTGAVESLRPVHGSDLLENVSHVAQKSWFEAYGFELVKRELPLAKAAWESNPVRKMQGAVSLFLRNWFQNAVKSPGTGPPPQEDLVAFLKKSGAS